MRSRACPPSPRHGRPFAASSAAPWSRPSASTPGPSPGQPSTRRSGMATDVTRLLGIERPVIQAPIGSLTNPTLASAVSNAGGLGMLALTWDDVDEARKRIRATRALTDRPFGINLILEWPQEERLAACLDEGIRIVSFFWGDPAPLIP